MLIQSISTTNYNIKQNSFKSRQFNFKEYINSPKFKAELKEISENKEAKELFANLSLVAGALLSAFTVFAHKHPEVKEFANKCLQELDINNHNNIEKEQLTKNNTEKNADFAPLIEKNPQRELYLKVTSYFPNLDKEYKKRLEVLITEPDNKNNQTTVDSIENIFDTLTKDGRLKTTRSYFESLDKNYSNCLDEIAINAQSALQVDKSLFTYLVLLNNEKITENEIKQWSKYSNLGCSEYMYMRKLLNDEQLAAMNDLKSSHKFTVKSFSKMDAKYQDSTFIFQLAMEKGMAVEEKLKTIAEVHKAIYGPIYLQGKRESISAYREKDIQTELMDNIIKDRQIDTIINLLNYAKPQVLKQLGLSIDELRIITPNNPRYRKIKNTCANEILKLNFNSPKMQTFCNIIDDEISDGILVTRHAKMRFLTRLVLNNENVTPKNIVREYNNKRMILEQELNDWLDKCNIFCYVHPYGYAPQFYLYNSKLGNNIKITLNNNGSVNTIYEDFRKNQALDTDDCSFTV